MASTEDAVTSLLTCPVCYDLAQPPVYQCTNGHLICSSCRPRIDLCPTCRESLGHIRSLVVEQLASTLSFPCAHQSYGCPFRAPLLQREEHQKSCHFRPMTCPFPESRCSWEGDHTTLLTHLQQRHPLARLYSRSTLLFMGIASGQPEPTMWASILACYDQHFLIRVIRRPTEIPLYRIEVLRLPTHPPNSDSTTSFSYFLALRKGRYSLQWSVPSVPTLGDVPLSTALPPLELPVAVVHSFSNRDNFKFFLQINTD
ncbi:E3 ubiquitin-protein ligase SIAH1B-like [Centruroides vittatus]|uniref:E3 ubiquitin-protein ligase SIAH1B-like n=1 Tax=Centruroides vittatus TaxID=120091 RepID=UPI00350FCE10